MLNLQSGNKAEFDIYKAENFSPYIILNIWLLSSDS